MDTTVRAETKRCALLANKAAAKARDGDWAAACRALEDIEHGPGNAASQASAPQVVEPTEPVAWYRTYYDQRMGISWDRVQPTLPGWGEHPLYDAPQASAPSVQVVPLTNDQLDAASTSEGGNLDLRRSFRAGALWAEEHYREALAQASALPTAQQPAVEPVAWGMANRDGVILDVITPAEHEREEGRYTIPLYASPTAQPAATQPAPWPKALDKVQVFLPNSETQAMCQPVFPCFDSMAMQEMEDRLLAQPAAPDVVADARRWQPIETAPKDGATYILVCCAGLPGAWVAHWEPVAVSGYRFDQPWRSVMLNHWHMPKEARYTAPTHWRPLPPAIDAELPAEGLKP